MTRISPQLARTALMGAEHCGVPRLEVLPAPFQVEAAHRRNAGVLTGLRGRG